jgi:hypothetical protein
MFRTMARLRDRHKVQQMHGRYIYMFDCWLIFIFLAFDFVLKHLNIFYNNIWSYLIANISIKMAKYERLEITGRKHIVLALLRKISPNFRTFPQTEETLYITIAEVVCKLQVSQNVLSTKFRCRIASQILLKFNCQDYKLFLYWLFDYSFK